MHTKCRFCKYIIYIYICIYTSNVLHIRLFLYETTYSNIFFNSNLNVTIIFSIKPEILGLIFKCSSYYIQTEGITRERQVNNKQHYETVFKKSEVNVAALCLRYK